MELVFQAGGGSEKSSAPGSSEGLCCWEGVGQARVELQLAPSRIRGNSWINEGWMIVETHVWSDVRLKGVCTAVMSFKMRNPA